MNTQTPHLHTRGWFYEPDSINPLEGRYYFTGRQPEDWDEGKDPLDMSRCLHCKATYDEKGLCQCQECRDTRAFLSCCQCFSYFGDDGRCQCDKDI